MRKILIVDDHPVVVEGLKMVLTDYECKTASTGKECLEILRSYDPELILLDINLPDINGIDLCKTILEKNKRIKILAISSFNQRSWVTRMMDNGAKGYVLKNATDDEIKTAIEEVLEGKEHYSPEIAEMIVKKPHQEETFLTRREIEILRLIADGDTNVVIADKLCVSPLTVDSHRKNLIMKLDAKNTASLIKIALTKGLIEMQDF
jgi:DNA-binding NarL/FixJ family response regulator